MFKGMIFPHGVRLIEVKIQVFLGVHWPPQQLHKGVMYFNHYFLEHPVQANFML